MDLIGNKLNPNETKRDAVHIALYPVTIGDYDVDPGDWVTIQKGKAYKVDENGPSAVGIVDPFLSFCSEGDRVYIFMKPGSITSLRHEWVSPIIGGDSYVWLVEYAKSLNVTLEKLLSTIKERKFLYAGSDYEGLSVPDEFWLHYAAYTGDVIEKYYFFRCSC